jgi:murein DD-endopeptidase MepM/ murein hydrolase activator NlpD
VTTPTTSDPSAWVWPVPAAEDGRLPEVSDGWGSQRPAHGGQPAHVHAGVDVMYRRDHVLPRGAVPPHESRGFFVPEGTHAIAARQGKVWSVAHTSTGWRVVIDHGKPWATVYQHLESVMLPEHHKGKRKDGGKALTVEIGEPLGVVGYDPTDGQKLRHLHFELWHGEGPVDPWPSLQHWRVTR